MLHDVSCPSDKVRCRLCCMRDFCAPEGLRPSEIDFLKAFVRQQDVTVAKEGALYRQGDPFHALFAVHTGSFKLVTTTPDGRERVTGFALAGDLIGMAAIASGEHADRAIALEKSGACLLPWGRIEQAAADIALVRRQLMRMLSREIRRGDEHRLLVAQGSAEGRFAAFLLDLSARLTERGFDGLRLRLSMSRPDMASFLGLSAATVSRLFTRFRDEGLIRARGRRIELARPAQLAALASPKGLSHAKN